MDNLIEVNQTVIKYLRQDVLSEEEEIILQRLMASEAGRKLIEQFQDKEWVRKNVAYLQGTQDISVWQTVNAKLEEREEWRARNAAPIVVPMRGLMRSLGFRYVAAAVVVLLAGSVYYFVSTSHNKPSHLPGQPPIAAAGLPGGSKAVLTLADGSQIRLDSSSKGVIAGQGNIQIVQAAGGRLAYDKSKKENAIITAYNTLVTPRAGQFAVSLADGTKVWLNNASTLRYPVTFTGSSREVELTGEAYFEVAKNPAMPFRVSVRQSGAGEDGGAVEVLGTAFNVMAYPDEGAERTTLVEGSVAFVRQGVRQLLRPDEQSVVDSFGELKLLPGVNVEEITAWKSGYFHFDHTGLEGTMRQLARWYNVDVEYKTSVTGLSFNGKIQRNLPLADVLKGLESQQIHFQLEGRKLFVLP
jgi:transmembrane sensor